MRKFLTLTQILTQTLVMVFTLTLASLAQTVTAQVREWSAFSGITTLYELQLSASDNQTPLWLNANKYGLSSLDKNNGYVRASAIRDIRCDEGRSFGLGYGIDFAVPYNYSTDVALQQLFVEMRVKAFSLTLGSKYQQMEKNQRLSSGSQALGINARPIPQARIALEDYWTLPFTRGWAAVKGHFSYGFMTDGSWQKDFTAQQSKWTEKALYHSKAGFLRVGRDDKPFSVELGLEMAAIFGGKVHWFDAENIQIDFDGDRGLKAFWHAFIPGGSDFREKEIGYENVEGNQVGAWVLRMKYRARNFDLSLYADRFFEDQSGIYNLGKYGYGQDGDWQKRNRRLFLYPMKDALLGLELNLKKRSAVKNIVVEYINSRFQSGPIYHDHNETIWDQIGGQDNFYNHEYYPGWQNYGQVIGNPLYLSPVGSGGDGGLEILNNRFFAWHFGVDGQISPLLSYRILASWQKGYGTYRRPFDLPKENTSVLVEADYDLCRRLPGLSIRLGYGLDKGGILGDNNGMQLTITYEY